MVTSVHCPPSDKIHFILSWPFFASGSSMSARGPFETIKPCTRVFRNSALVTEVDKKPR